MSTLKLADIPCEVPDKINDNELGQRITAILKQINFPNREKTVIAYDSNIFGRSIRMQLEATNTKDGSPVSLQHTRFISADMSDQQLAREICILMSQTAIHEFLENFRYQGEIMFDPHLESRNDILFASIEKACTFPKPKTEHLVNVDHLDALTYSFHYTTGGGATASTNKATFVPEPKETTPFDKAKAKRLERKQAFNKFGAKDWRDKKRAA